MNSVPFRCIWCLRRAPDVTFNVSHVLPECVGIRDQHVLPPGIVCETCNSYFGHKVEPGLLEDPLFHTIAVFLSLVDPDDMNLFRNKIFDPAHRPEQPLTRDLKLNLDLRGPRFAVDISYTIKGRLTKDYSRKDLAILSRAVHKIAFESLAWSVLVGGSSPDLDPFSADFNPVRLWTREGQPHGTVRAVLRKPNPTISPNYTIRCWKFGRAVGMELMLFADWYGVSLTSAPDDVLSDLVGWIGPNADDKTWCIAEEICGVKNVAPE
jgi:hypothetical protein